MLTSVSMRTGRGSDLLTVQQPPIGCSEKTMPGQLGFRLLGGAGEPLSSDSYLWQASWVPLYFGRLSRRFGIVCTDNTSIVVR
mmetsp:Transcript_52331/g.137689  ORF Transcript_52331/g.137689 Transcript_52331/m.137689 type:complete len:83 (+) Transcript_52331:193-441(+)